MSHLTRHVLCLSIAAFLSGSAHAGGCEKDTDCKGDRICEAGVCTDPGPGSEPSAPATPDNADPEPSPEDAGAPEASDPTGESDGSSEDAAKPTGGEPSAEATAAPAAPSDPKDWWKKEVRKAEAPVLQAMFDKMPRPFKQKGGGKLVYHRAVPVVVADVHDTTTLWGGKKQVNVRFIGISKIHTTATLEKVTAKTPGIAYCPVNCSRIKEIVTAGDDVTFVYDGDIREWAGHASDVQAGYKRKMGKHFRAQCTFPVLYSLAPANTWLDPEEVKAIQTEVVNELNRYCGL